MDYILYEKHTEHVVVITLNRPERLNAWGKQLSAEAEEAFTRFQEDPEARVAVLCGAGRAFCAGADLKERGDPDLSSLEFPVPHMFNNDQGAPELAKPVIAAVHGYVLGAGLNRVMLRCDIRIAAESTKFGMPEVARGIMDLATPFFYQSIPLCIIAEMDFTADFISAERAYQFGMLNQVVPSTDVLPVALTMAERIAQHSPQALQRTKQNLYKSFEPPQTAFLWEKHFGAQQGQSADAQEGVLAFNERRVPRWTNA